MDTNTVQEKVIAYNKMYPRRVPVKAEKGFVTVRPLQGSPMNVKRMMDALVFGKDYKFYTK